MTRDKIWRNFQNSIYKNFVLEEMMKALQERERVINIILAFASSGSVATWAVWNKFSYVWAGIVAISNVILVLKPYFPYSKYIKEARDKYIESNELNLEFEKLWYRYDSEQINEEQSLELFFQLRERMKKVYFFEEDVTIQNTKGVIKNAEMKTKTFFKLNYDVDINL